MARGVGTESAHGLRQLPLAADAAAPSGLVPGDGDVDETLEEVLLCVVGRAPRELELLVRGEVLAPPDER